MKKIKYEAIKENFRKEKIKKIMFPLDIIFGTLLLIFLLLVIYSTFFHFNKCEDETCFLNYLKDCNRATFEKQGDFSFDYSIKGYLGSKCVVEVKLTDSLSQIELREVYSLSKMDCYVPFSNYYYPENDLSKCSGLLKEGLQEILIERLKKEIVNNIEDLNKGLSTV